MEEKKSAPGSVNSSGDIFRPASPATPLRRSQLVLSSNLESKFFDGTPRFSIVSLLFFRCKTMRNDISPN
jgi:hypothetical protein